MLILLSSAKTLDFETPYAEEATRARFATEAGRIARAAARMSADDLEALMHISPKLAELNRERFRKFGRAEHRPAIRAFAGDVYRGFDAASADDDTIAFAQDHVRILSGLYGVLRPLDAMRPYRLEMGTKWAPAGGAKLTDHWGDKVARAVRADLKAEGSDIVVNLASNEYFDAVRGRLAKKTRLVTPDFRVTTARGLQFQSFPAKVARGAMARWICDERIDDVAALSGFDRDGWTHDKDSAPDQPLFIRG